MRRGVLDSSAKMVRLEPRRIATVRIHYGELWGRKPTTVNMLAFPHATNTLLNRGSLALSRMLHGRQAVKKNSAVQHVGDYLPKLGYAG